jgi:xanthine dehydrogenase YagS FAD-binding subunit
MNVALAALDATVQVESLAGKRSIPISEFHRLPGTTPNLDTNLKHGELVTSIELSPAFISKNSCYLKIRDRQSYAFALVSVAAGLEMERERIQSARLALGGVAHKPWRSLDAEKALIGAVATPDSFARAADILLQGAKAYEHNAFKIQLAKRGIVRALTIAAHGTTSGVNV